MLALPIKINRDGLTLRPSEPRHAAFLRALYSSSRPDAALLANWPVADREAFLDQQFAAQDTHYQLFYQGADFLIVTLEQTPIGRLTLHRGPRDWRVVDISLRPEWRGQRLGTALLRWVQAAAATAGAEMVSLHVDARNPARALYRRLGFRECGGDEVYVQLKWNTGTENAAQLNSAS